MMQAVLGWWSVYQTCDDDKNKEPTWNGMCI